VPTTTTGPLTFGQLSQLRDADSQPPEGRHQVNVKRVTPLDTGVSAEALRHAAHRLRARHEGLRTTYDLHDPARLRQLVHPPGHPVPVDIPEIAVPAGEDPRAFADRLAEQLQARLFDLATEEPWRIAIVTVAGRPAYFVTVLHHIIADLWSDTVIAEDFQALLDDQEPRGPAGSPLQLARAQHAANRQADEAYQRQVYTRAAAASAFDAVASPKVLVNAVLDTETAFLAAARKAAAPGASIPGLSMPSLTLAAYCYAAHRTLGVDNIMVSALTSNRWYPGTARLVGNMVQWARIPSRHIEGQPFEEFARQLHENSLLGYRHACYDVDTDDRIRREVASTAGPIGLEINLNYAPIEPEPLTEDTPDGQVVDVPVPYYGGPAFYLIVNHGHRLRLIGRTRWVGFEHAAMSAFLTEIHDILVNGDSRPAHSANPQLNRRIRPSRLSC